KGEVIAVLFEGRHEALAVPAGSAKSQRGSHKCRSYDLPRGSCLCRNASNCHNKRARACPPNHMPDWPRQKPHHASVTAPKTRRAAKANKRKKKKHSRVEIASKLAQANDLATQGKLQSEIARTLGVSVMTLHRWRMAPPGPRPALVATHEAGHPYWMRRGGDRIAELQLENSRLRRLGAHLLLEKIKLEEAVQSQSSSGFSFDAPLRIVHRRLLAWRHANANDGDGFILKFDHGIGRAGLVA